LIQVPCFILQPFCENAIWHGLLHKEGKGHLVIAIHKEGERLMVSIRDDGVGLAEAARRKTKNTEPMGLQLTGARLALFNQDKRTAPQFTIQDVRDSNGHSAGTEAMITINTRSTYD
jgi:sensor histidine kinase YesM